MAKQKKGTAFKASANNANPGADSFSPSFESSAKDSAAADSFGSAAAAKKKAAGKVIEILDGDAENRASAAAAEDKGKKSATRKPGASEAADTASAEGAGGAAGEARAEGANGKAEGAGEAANTASADEVEGAEDAPEDVPDDTSDDATADATADADANSAENDNAAFAEINAEALKQAQAQAAEWQDKYVRLHAEWDTYRRRMNEQREAERARATEKLVCDLLPVIDDFERTINYATEHGETGLLDGVSAVHSKFVGVLEKDGVEAIDPAGEAFNSLEAQAVATVDDTSAFDETVAEVYQKGYKMGKKVLRPAMVTVTSGGPKRPHEDEEA